MKQREDKRPFLTYLSGLVLGGLIPLAVNLLLKRFTNLGGMGYNGPSGPIDSFYVGWSIVGGICFSLYLARVLMKKPERWWVPMVVAMAPFACCGSCLQPQNIRHAASTPIGVLSYLLTPPLIMGYTALAWWLIWQEKKV